MRIKCHVDGVNEDFSTFCCGCVMRLAKLQYHIQNLPSPKSALEMYVPCATIFTQKVKIAAKDQVAADTCVLPYIFLNFICGNQISHLFLVIVHRIK